MDEELRAALERVKLRLLLEAARPKTCCSLGTREPVEVRSLGELRGYLQKCRGVMVMFYSPTCPYCRAMTPLYIEAAEAYGGKLGFLRVNTYEVPEAAQAFIVMGVPTTIGFAGGREVVRLYGLASPEELEDAVKRVLREGGCEEHSSGEAQS